MLKRLLSGLVLLLSVSPLMAEAQLWDTSSTFGYNNNLYADFHLYLEGPYFSDSRGELWVKDQAILRLQLNTSRDGQMSTTLNGIYHSTDGSGGADDYFTYQLSENDHVPYIHWFADDPGLTVWPLHFERDDSGDGSGRIIHADQTAPVVTLSPYATALGGNADPILPNDPADDLGRPWFQKGIVGHINLSVTDPRSGVASIEKQIDSGAWVAVTGFPLLEADYRKTAIDISSNFATDGLHTISIRSTDHVGNISAVQTASFYIDTTNPVFASGQVTATLLGGGASSAHTAVKISWPQASDPAAVAVISNIKAYEVRINNELVATIPDAGTTYFSYSLSAYDRSSLDTGLLISVTVLDKALNAAVLDFPTADHKFVLPRLVSIQASWSSVLSSSAQQTDPLRDTVVTLPLNITGVDLYNNYSQLVLKRQGAANLGTNLDATVTIDPAQVVNSSGALLDSSPTSHWTTYTSVDADHVSRQYLAYVEKIAPLMGIGGKTADYSIATQTVKGQTAEAGGRGQTVALPYHPGQMQIEIVDMEGNSVVVRPNGTTTSHGKALVVDAAGRVQVKFQALGIDQDNWIASVHELIPQQIDATHVITQDVQLGGAANNDIPYLYDAETYDAANHLYPALVVPVSLSLGDNNIRLQWVQGADAGHTVHYSKFVDLYFVLSFDGRFTLGLSTPDSPAVRRQDSGAILVAPGQPLGFKLGSLQPGDDDFAAVAWSFGDQSFATGGTVSHTYNQAPGQLTDSASYSITISNLPGETPPAVFPVIVQDTQDGALYQSEVWNGPHTITGNVIVPLGKTLEIGTIGTTNTPVRFAGGLAAHLDQGILVQGTLAVGRKHASSVVSGAATTFEPDPDHPSATGQTWGTLLVRGTASFDNAVISGGDRGVTAAPGSTVALNRTSLNGNDIGLHVLSGAVTVKNGAFTANKAYGVKEDGARPKMTDNSFEGNGMDYYQDGKASISLADLNLLAGNGGNHQ